MLLVVGWRGAPGTKDEPQHMKQGRIMFNLFRCEAHNEAMKTAFRLMHEGRFDDDAEARSEVEGALSLLDDVLAAS